MTPRSTGPLARSRSPRPVNVGVRRILTGSGIIVPRVHRETLFELTESEVASTFGLLREVKVRLDSSPRT